MKKRNNLIFLLLSVCVILPALFGLFHSGFFLSDDGNWMVIRFSAFYEVLRSGEFPVRFLTRLSNGYGYPVADFLYPLFMYLAVPIHILKLNFVDSIKIVFGLSFIFSSVFSFLWLRKFFDNTSSFVGSTVYSYFPYHLWDMYKRGSIGEMLALAIAPFIFWQIERGSLILTSIGIALLVLAHNTIAVLFLPLIVLYMFVDVFISKNKFKLFCKYILEIILGMSLSAFFWIPALYDLKYTVFSKTQVSDFSRYFADLNLIGMSSVLIISLVILLIILGKIEIKKHRLTLMFLAIGFLSIFLSLNISINFWKIFPVSFVQFPFRILSVLMVCLAFLSSVCVSVFKDKSKILISVVILFLAIFSSWKFLFPQNYQYYPDSFYSTNQDSTTVKNEYMPKWVKNLPANNTSAAVVLNGQEKLNILDVSPNMVSVQAYFAENRIVQFNKAYFPGWIVNVDGQQASIDYNSNGLIRVAVPKGNHSVILRFQETGIRIFADVVSLLGVVSIAFLFIRKKI